MSRVIVLDASPLGLICHAKPRGEAVACRAWFEDLIRNGHRVFFPTIAEFEVRRELIRVRSHKSLARLDFLISTYEKLDLTPDMLRHAAHL